ncbi:DoxX family protein [Mariniflexile litorale]|uniref:DoxX family protein n=1 Tax=Mariniflexile litorale TaxID=3045158 RepID=A0AAU7EKQ4_9FLAO|nr:DoxX family protein [Mariniflexile sp. KMM 9835]MDQ8211426.1 DoxX family protein [Mariniflexile sp. KMM 9835]
MTNQKNNKAIHITLWIAQVLLAVMFIMAGIMKASQPIEALSQSLPWVTTVPVGLVRFIGISELLGGLGLILPSLLRFKPFLTVWAALGLATVMILAAIFHASRGEFSAIGVNVVLIAVFLFIAWGRSKKARILSKH